MTNKELGELERVNLREVWKREDKDFTPWLAKYGLDLLGDAIGVDLELLAVEESVGTYRADILCNNRNGDGSRVVIENQLGRSDHKHLGQLLTYAAGLEAVTLIWIVAEFSDEHRAVLDNLNETAGNKFRIFGLEIELWKIDDSRFAPKFNVVSRPNDWNKSLRAMNSTEKFRYHYWQGFATYLWKRGSHLKNWPPRGEPWIIFPIGNNSHIAGVLNTQKNGGRIYVELVMHGKAHKKSFIDILKSEKETIEKNIGGVLDWKGSVGQETKIIFYNENFDPKNEDQKEAQYEWLKEKLEAFDRAFRGRLEEFCKS